MLEPFMDLTYFCSRSFVGAVMTVAQNKKGDLLDILYHISKMQF